MTDLPTAENPSDSVAEYFRLALAKLGQLKLPVTPVNYGLMYYLVAGEDVEFSAQIDKLIAEGGFTDHRAQTLYTEFICGHTANESNPLVQELLMTIAQILGMVMDLSGRTATSHHELENQLESLAASKDPKRILDVASDILAETRLDKVSRQATLDSLTGLHNRRGFDDALVEALENREASKRDFCLVLIDIDHFKQVNDTHGHLVGDKVLSRIAKQLRNLVRGNDYIARYGGEEFAAILPDTPVTGAYTVAENIRKTIGRQRLKHTGSGKEIGTVTVSLGVACYQPGESTDELISRCDTALYRAKELGRNQTAIAAT